MNSFRQMAEEFYEIEGGMPRLNAIRNAMLQADEQNDIVWMFLFRFAYLQESIFCGDRYYAMIIFPELLALYDENEQIERNLDCSHSMLVAFKWIVEAAPEFPQISKAEIDSYFRLFKRRLIEHGCSLSIYYMKRSLFYMHCDRAIAAADFYRFLEAPLDEISDGRALYHDQQVIYYLSIGDEEKALHAAMPIFAGTLTSNALPQATYHEFIRFYLRRGEYDKALEYAKLTERRVDGNAYYLDIIGTLMLLYGLTQPERGVALFCRNYPVFAQSKNPNLRMHFAIGAHHLFRRLLRWHEFPKSFDITAETELRHAAENHDAASFAAHFYTIANDYAVKFDTRNGTDDFVTMLHFEYPPYSPAESD